jgi:hypothetical protein
MIKQMCLVDDNLKVIAEGTKAVLKLPISPNHTNMSKCYESVRMLQMSKYYEWVKSKIIQIKVPNYTNMSKLPKYVQICTRIPNQS